MGLGERLAEACYRRGARPKRLNSVAASAEFRRVADLPRRVWQDDPDLSELSELLRETYGRKESSMSLRPAQAAALRDCHDRKGLVAPLPVGAGKTLITILLPTVLEAKRPLLFVPPRRRASTKAKIKEYGEHWRLNPPPRVMGSNELGLKKNAAYLCTCVQCNPGEAKGENLQPDLIIIDEAHQWRNKTAGRTKRLNRYLLHHADTIVVPLSGTLMDRSILDAWHLMAWTLRENTPMPLRYVEVRDWSRAIDPDSVVGPADRLAPGALLELCTPEERKEIETVGLFQAHKVLQNAYSRRVMETPGVVGLTTNEVHCSLEVTPREVTAPPEVTEHLKHLADFWETPDGDMLSEATELARVNKQLLCGFYYKWDPPAPEDWKLARKEWKSYVRNRLKRNRSGLDTELQVWNECESDPDSAPIFWHAWKAIKDTFRPNTVPVWVSDFLIRDILAWLKQAPGIVWLDHVALGEALQAAGVPYYGAGTDVDAGGALPDRVAMSVRAHGTGANLQQFHRSLVVTWPKSGKMSEQLLGRTHRQGQTADLVTYEYYNHHPSLIAAVKNAVGEAEFLRRSTGQPQKLLYADVDI